MSKRDQQDAKTLKGMDEQLVTGMAHVFTENALKISQVRDSDHLSTFEMLALGALCWASVLSSLTLVPLKT